MAKRSRKSDPEETARRKLADAQAKLQAAQEERSRAVTRGEQNVVAARARATRRVEKATRAVERQASRVARAEATLLSAREAKQARKRKKENARQSTSRANSVPIVEAPTPDLASVSNPDGVATELAVFEEVQSQLEESSELVTATSPEEAQARVSAGQRALETLRTHFAENGATFTEWLNASGISRKTFLAARKKLVEQGSVSREGNGPGARYRVTD